MIIGPPTQAMSPPTHAQTPAVQFGRRFRQGLYVAEGPKNGAAVFRQGLYIVEGPVNEEEDDEAKLYRPRQFFIN